MKITVSFFQYFIEKRGFNINCERRGASRKQVIFVAIDCALKENSLEKVEYIAQISGVDFTKKQGIRTPLEYVDQLSKTNSDREGILSNIKEILSSNQFF